MYLPNQLLKTRKKKNAKKSQRRRTLSIESVEDRRLMAADVALTSGGVIEITGTDQNDVAHVAISNEDTIRVTTASGASAAEVYDFERSAVNKIVFEGLGGDDAFDNATDVRSVATGGEGNDFLAGGDLRDHLYGGKGSDTILGRGGNDELRGGKDGDWIDGGDGNDDIYGASGNDVLLGGDGNDEIFAGAGNDTVRAGAGDDIALGEAGNDIVDGGLGADQLYGGVDSDVLIDGLDDEADELRGGSDHAVDYFFASENDFLPSFDDAVDQLIDVSEADAVLIARTDPGVDPVYAPVYGNLTTTGSMVFITQEPERFDTWDSSWNTSNPGTTDAWDLWSINEDADPGMTNPDLALVEGGNDPSDVAGDDDEVGLALPLL